MKNYKEYIKENLENLEKTFEQKVGKFWKIPTTEIEYTASLLKIVDEEYKVQGYLNDSFFLDEIKKHDYVLFFEYLSSFEEDGEIKFENAYWFDMNINQMPFYEKGGQIQDYDYQGEIKLNEKDLKNARLFIETEKYNL